MIGRVKQAGGENVSPPEEVYMKRESVYIQKFSKEGRGWINLIKCLEPDVERITRFLIEQNPSCRFRVWGGKEREQRKYKKANHNNDIASRN